MHFTALPRLVLASCTRVWIGWWALIPISAAFLWIWLNPRIFPKPRSTNNWASKGVFGERIWLDRDKVPVPRHHRTLPNALNLMSAAGMALIVWGVVGLAVWPTLLGAAISYLGKLWFIDRMV
jgi:hypothetical protein